MSAYPIDDEFDDLDGALVERFIEVVGDPYEEPADPLAGEARPVNSRRRHRSRGRAVHDLPAL